MSAIRSPAPSPSRGCWLAPRKPPSRSDSGSAPPIEPPQPVCDNPAPSRRDQSTPPTRYPPDESPLRESPLHPPNRSPRRRLDELVLLLAHAPAYFIHALRDRVG